MTGGESRRGTPAAHATGKPAQASSVAHRTGKPLRDRNVRRTNGSPPHRAEHAIGPGSAELPHETGRKTETTSGLLPVFRFPEPQHPCRRVRKNCPAGAFPHRKNP